MLTQSVSTAFTHEGINMKSTSHFSRLALGAAVLGAAFVISPAHASDDACDMSRSITGSLTATQIKELATKAGYVDVYDIDIDHDSVEVKAFSANGQKAKIYMDPVTGEVLSLNVDYDEHDDDDHDYETDRG